MKTASYKIKCIKCRSISISSYFGRRRRHVELHTESRERQQQ